MKKTSIILLLLTVLISMTLLFISCDNSTASPPSASMPLPTTTTKVSDSSISTKCTHSYMNQVTTEPTCTEDGIETFTCTKCKDFYTEVISAAGHTEIVYEAEPATCLLAGKTEGKYCSTCDTILSEQKTIKATGHTVVTDSGVEATCTVEGKTTGTHCSTCNTVLLKQTAIPATGIHLGQGICIGCGESFLDMVKNILIENNGRYSSNNYTVSYNTSKNQIEIKCNESSSSFREDFTLYIPKDSESLTWKYSYERDIFDYSNGRLYYSGTEENYMIGQIASSVVSPSTTKLDYTYNNFSTQEMVIGSSFTSKAKKAQRTSAQYLLASIDVLKQMLSEYGNGSVTLYNLGFSGLQSNPSK